MSPEQPALIHLTPREREVSLLLLQGCPNWAIGKAMQPPCTAATVKFHLSNIFKKLKVDNRVSAAVRLTEYFGG